MSTYNFVHDFQKKYPLTISWFRLKKHAKLLDKNLYPDEKIIYAFPGQIHSAGNGIFNTGIFAITNKRIITAQDRLIIGYKINAITLDLYNDLQVSAGVIWGSVTVDTVKETLVFTHIQKSGLIEIQKSITSYIIKSKKEYYKDNRSL